MIEEREEITMWVMYTNLSSIESPFSPREKLLGKEVERNQIKTIIHRGDLGNSLLLDKTYSTKFD